MVKKKWQWKALSPFACLPILFWRDRALVLWMTASFYAVFMCIQTSVPNIFQDTHYFNELTIGLSYLPGGFGIVFAGPANDKLMDFNYRRTAKPIGHEIDNVSGDDLGSFSIEHARIRSSFVLLAIYVAAQLDYGWSILYQTHPAVPLILHFVIGFIFTCFNQKYSTLLIDIFPENPSTASAAGAITRCGLSALAVGVMQPSIDALGYGWYFTLLTAICGVLGGAAIWLIRTKGILWRGRRLGKAEEKKRVNESVGTVVEGATKVEGSLNLTT